MENENFLATFQPDVIDLKILQILSKNGKLGNKEIANEIGLSVSPTFERIKRLERIGAIEGYKAIINKKTVGKGLQVFCNVSLKAHNLDLIEAFEDQVVHIEEVAKCYHLAGNFDYSLLIEVADIESYQNFLKQKLASIPNIANVQSSFVLSLIKN